MHAKCMQPIRTIESDMTIRMQRTWDSSVKQSKPIVGEGGNRWMGSGKTQLDTLQSPKSQWMTLLQAPPSSRLNNNGFIWRRRTGD